MGLLWKTKKFFQDIKYRKVHLEKNSRINLGVRIRKKKNLYIGSNTYINRRGYCNWRKFKNSYWK